MASNFPSQLPSDNRGHYHLLGVSISASDEEIKKAYKAMALRYHPDKTLDSSSEEMMKKINSAKAVLLDPVKRSEYDEEHEDDCVGTAEFSLPHGKYHIKQSRTGVAGEADNACTAFRQWSVC